MAQGVIGNSHAKRGLNHLAAGRLHDLNFLIREVIQFIDQFVYLAVGGVDLSLEQPLVVIRAAYMQLLL